MVDMEARLGAIEHKLDKLTEAISTMAVQDEKLVHLTQQVSGLWAKYDRLMSDDGSLAKIRRHQASCPREQIRWMWFIVIPLGLTILGMAIGLFELYIKLGARMPSGL